MLLYSLLHLTGYADMTLDELKHFRQLGSKTAGHPEYGHAQGIETTTGPLGQGLANSVGFALAERILNSRFGNELVDHHTYVIAGDGCLMEGISQEAISLAGHLKLSKLIVLWDNNSISIDGPTSLSTSENQIGRFQAANWATLEVDGHDADAVAAVLKKAQTHDKPTLIACKTVIGYGAPTKAGTAATHGSPLGKDEIAGARQKLGWAYEPFVVPDAIRAAWTKAGQRGQADYAAWAKRHDSSANRAEHDRVMAHELPANFAATVNALKDSIAAQAPKIATRQSSQNVLEALVPVMPELIGGSADLTGSNNTKTKTATPVKAGAYGGNYIYYGIREHEMAAAMNGLALHGGIIPFGGTFLVFTDYCRPAIRLSALMRQRVIYVMTHDSIGLGEDGPTHQPVEHLAALRAIPSLMVFRPADTMETAECWALALSTKNRPSILALTRQALPHLRADSASANHCARGGYIIRPAKAARKVTLIATGSEVSLAVEARETLEAQGIGTAVVSLPCWELFDEQPESYRKDVLGDGLRVGIEAAGDFGWSRYLGSDGIFVGMPGFGASAPAPELYKHFGITAAAVVEKVKARL
jgi:transketolase